MKTWINKHLRAIKRCFQMYSLILNDEDWDYCYLLDWIEYKLKRMRKYFNTHDIVVNEKEYAKQINTLLKILDVGYNADYTLDKDLKVYVNTKNIDRFFNSKEIEFLSRHKLKYNKCLVREIKAKKLFWRYLEHYIERWWD